MVFKTETIAALLHENASPEMAVLIAAGRPAGTSGLPQDAAGTPATVDPQRLFELARVNKMLGVLPLAPAALPPGCAGLAPRLLQVHLRTVTMNRQAMTVTAEVVRALQGMRVVVLKGPFQQLALHGHPARRPSGDIDLFVEPRDRARAAALLNAKGFVPTEADRALWWIGFLGEQHLARARDGAVVDLHHRLQQVGLPAWRRAGAVLDRAGTWPHEGVAIPVPSAIDGCLLLSVTLAKALLAHEPCGGAAIEFGHEVARLSPADWTRLWAAATAAGQARTMAMGLVLATACLGPLSLADGSPAQAVVPAPRRLTRDPGLLRELVFQPWRRSAEAARRRQILMMLAQGRPHVMAVEGTRAVLSSLVLNWLERRDAPEGQGPGSLGDRRPG